MFSKKEKAIIMILIFMISWSMLSLYQQSRYSNEYNCVGMSYDCARFFRSIGLSVEVVRGWRKEGFGGHCWVRLFGWLEFESTTLMFMRISEEYEITKIEVIE